jgi:hypothetical protein
MRNALYGVRSAVFAAPFAPDNAEMCARYVFLS